MSDPQRTASYLGEITLLRAEVAMWKGIHEGAVAATTADVDRLRAENERLRAALHASREGSLQLLGQVGQLSDEITRLRAAATALIEFHNGPREAKRPDVFHLLMVRLNAALEEKS